MDWAYPPESFDRYLALKPTFLLVAIMIYCTLPLVFILLAYNPSPKLQVAFMPLQHYATPFSLLCGLPAALVIGAWVKRLPDSGNAWRHIWRLGKWLLSLSLVSQLLLLYSQVHASLWASYALTTKDRFLLVQMGLSLLALYYLWRVRRVSDVFDDFPSKPQ
ncbi:MAG: DUF2919 family protein [Thiobacillus sp.]|nr:DUF2919 family protein [Thiobacillus sp.]